ncbi:hypothetical protein [Ktedonospora formicarum]|uniref:UDP-N-acetylenolpyruvoylglucosamine reductase n=1 Tax=Ktedonospora formicarum TaxID=2778364 RepID=A0A8J3I7U2_9CHLR|nr:hypothetical protein [Ktedonospora formicarum]GHO48728.1 hypothetical protein KSX_68910 [Ktedonospora formicarum]
MIPPHHLIEPAEIVLLLGFRLHAGNPQQLLAQSDRYLYERRQHEPDLPHTGPIFKDPPKTSARELLEQVGLRGQVYGQAQMTERNANYLTNLGGASADDLLSLIITAHQQVLTQCGIDLALNIDLLGEWPHPNVTSAS